jgi:hypothetical protein
MIIKSVFAGVALSILTGATALGASMLGASFVLAAFVLFGMPSAYLFNLMLSTEVFYQLFPEGGGPAFVGLSIVGSFFQLLVIYSLGFYFLWFSRHAR